MPIVCFITLAPFKAQAVMQVSESEKAVFAYHALIQKEPNYERWVMYSEAYQSASPQKRTYILDEESVRLKWGQGTYNPAEDFLELTISAIATYSEQGGKPVLAFYIPDAQQDQPFFPYSYGKQWIALLIKEIHNITYLDVDLAQAHDLQFTMPRDEGLPVKVRLRVRPLKAQSEPVMIEEQEFLPLSGDIAFMEILHQDTGTVIYTHNAPWYLSDNQNEVIDILLSTE